MKKFYFTKKYFNKLVVDDEFVRIRISETPSFDVFEEDYSLRVETYFEKDGAIHRKYAIEHHSKQHNHFFPHLQFKFHTEQIGSFWIRLDFKNQKEYENAILGFIYKMKLVLEDFEFFKKGICSEVFVLELVNKLSTKSDFLSMKIFESIQKYGVEFQNNVLGTDKIRNIKQNSALAKFLGEYVVEEIIKKSD